MSDTVLRQVKINVDLKVDNKIPLDIAQRLECKVLELKEINDELQQYFDGIKERNVVVLVQDEETYYGTEIPKEELKGDYVADDANAKVIDIEDSWFGKTEDSVVGPFKKVEDSDSGVDAVIDLSDVVENKSEDVVVVQEPQNLYQQGRLSNNPTWSSLVVSFASPIAEDAELMSNLAALKSILTGRLAQFNESNAFNVTLTQDEYNILVDDTMAYLYKVSEQRKGGFVNGAK